MLFISCLKRLLATFGCESWWRLCPTQVYSTADFIFSYVRLTFGCASWHCRCHARLWCHGQSGNAWGEGDFKAKAQAEKRNNTKWKGKRDWGKGRDWRVREGGNWYVSAMTHPCRIFIASGGREEGTWRRGEPVGGRANCLGGVWDDITVPINSEWRWRERGRGEWKQVGSRVKATGHKRQMTDWRWKWESATEIKMSKKAYFGKHM